MARVAEGWPKLKQHRFRLPCFSGNIIKLDHHRGAKYKTAKKIHPNAVSLQKEQIHTFEGGGGPINKFFNLRANLTLILLITTIVVFNLIY